jgi:hypothetical protein
MTFRTLIEKIIKTSDDKIDAFIEKEWKGSVETYTYSSFASTILGQYCNVLVTSDRKFMHINPKEIDAKELAEIKNVYKLKSI